MAKESPFIPDPRKEGAPDPEGTSGESPSYWANPPSGTHESELFQAPPIENAPRLRPIARAPIEVDDVAVGEPAIVEPVIDHMSEAQAVGEYDAGEFREVAVPVRSGLFARYTPPVTDPLQPAGADQKKRRHKLLRSRQRST